MMIYDFICILFVLLWCVRVWFFFVVLVVFVLIIVVVVIVFFIWLFMLLE